MYCPRCGQQQTAEGVRFCSRCGLKLDAARASIPADPTAETGAAAEVPREAARARDLNAGAILMSLCVLLTSAVIAVGDVPPSGALVVLVLISLPVLLASGRLLPVISKALAGEETRAEPARARPQDVGLGAVLMFAGTLLSLSAATMVPGRLGTPVFFLAFFASLALLLASSRALLRAARNFFDAGDAPSPDFAPSRAAVAPPIPATGALEEPSTASDFAALPPAQGVPVALSGARRAAVAEPPSPHSVTERTTNLLQRD